MAKPKTSNLQRAQRLYSMQNDEGDWRGDLAMHACRGVEVVPASIHDAVREERATRYWFAHRRGGWSPIDIVLRSPLHETETWYDPRGQHEKLTLRERN